MAIGIATQRGLGTNALQALRHSLAQAPRILSFALRLVVRLALLILPFVAVAAALALFQMMWEITGDIAAKPVDLEISGVDHQELLVNFLEEFLYRYDARGHICTRVEITSVSDKKLTATAWLRPFDNQLDQEILGVNAVTYHQLYIGQHDNVWLGRIFLDI